FGEGPAREAVPRCEDLVVSARMHATLACLVERSLDRRDAQGIRLSRDVEDALALEVRAAVGPPVPPRVFRIGGAERVAKLIGGPHEELALVALGIRVLRRIEAPGRVGHLAQEIVERLLADATALGVAEREPA